MSEPATAPLADALENFTAALVGLWHDPGFPGGFYIPDRTRANVWTEAKVGAPRLPATRRPIRGTPQVDVRVGCTRERLTADTAAGWVAHALEDSGRPFGAGNEVPTPPAWQGMVAARTALMQAVADTAMLGLRAAEASIFGGRRLGLTQDEATAIRRVHAFGAREFAAPEVERALTALGVLTAADCRAFADPSALRDRLAAQFAELAALTTDRYEVTAYLNGPPVDTDEPLVLLDGITYGRATGTIRLAAATDEDLAAAAYTVGRDDEYRLPPGLASCNAVVTFPFEESIEVPGSELTGIHEGAVGAARGVLDALRLVRPDDLGVSFVLLRPLTPYAPPLPVPGWAELQPAAAAWSTRRQAFGAPLPQPITADEVAAVAALVPRTTWPPTVKGLDVAVRRFRDAYERYAPDDPERLLDMAIALEAVLLNDNDTKEQLRFRVALRAARLTETGVDARTEVFRTVRDLYDLRSKIAHGETAGSLSSSAAKKLAVLQATAPTAMRAVLRCMFDGRGPTSLDGDPLRAWWTRLELG